MSLRVWLPLNGTLDNQGLDDIIAIANNGVAVDNNGKIGKCYSFDGSNDYISFSYSFPNEDWSYSIWFYTTATSTQTLGCCRNGAGFGFSAFLISNKLRIDGVIGQNIQWTTPYTFPTNIWVNLVITSKNGLIKYYINGEYQSSKTVTRDISKLGTVFSIGASQTNGSGWGNFFKGKINDVRIYDHALSPLEVKQISQGLILHYPLNNDGFGQENLLIDTLKDQNKTHTTYNISDYNFSEHLVEGEKYTITASVTTSSEKTFVGMYHSGGSYSMSGWMEVNEDGFYQKTFTATANMANRTQGIGYGFCRVYVSNNPSGGQSSYTLAGTANVNWIKIEKGIKATPWGPNKVDILYNSSIEYDCSGYQKNGEKIGVDYDSDTPKYDVSSVFSASPSVIKIPNQNYAIQGSQNMTISVWAYKEDWSQYSQRIYSCTESGGFNIQPEGSNIQWPIAVYTNEEKTSHKYASSSPNLYISIPKTDLSSGWHMFTWIYTTGGTSLYIDGILEKTMAGTSYGLYFNPTAPLVLGGQASAKSYTSPYLNGKLSDFRIYCTALSAEDILALYKNSVYIDNEGNLYGAELREV